MYHISSKCGIPIFKFSKNKPIPGHQRKYPVRPSCKRRERGKAKHGFQRKRGRVIPWDGDVDGPAPTGRSAHRKTRSSGSGMDFSAVPVSAPLLPLFSKGRSSPRRMGPNGSVNRLENRRRICRQPFSLQNADTGDSPLPHRPRTTALPPRQETKKAVYNASGVTAQFPLTVCSSRKTGCRNYLSNFAAHLTTHLPLPLQKINLACASVWRTGGS